MFAILQARNVEDIENMSIYTIVRCVQDAKTRIECRAKESDKNQNAFNAEICWLSALCSSALSDQKQACFDKK